MSRSTTHGLTISFLLSATALLALACANINSNSSALQRDSSGPPLIYKLDDYLITNITPADGFDFPVGTVDGTGNYQDLATGKQHTGWYVATSFAESYDLGIHPGEDWNGNGGGNTDLGQNVYSVANGRIISAAHYGRLWGNVIIIEHLFYENHHKRKIRSVYAHLNEIKIAPGDVVRRRQLIGTVGQDPDKLFHAHLHLELRWDETLDPTYWPTSNGKDVNWVKEHYAEPSKFITDHRKLFVPHEEVTLLLVDQENYRMRIIEKGKNSGDYEVGFGQAKGHKRVEGDNKTPVGMYFVVQKHRGDFDGPYGAYYGGHWIKINYPNKFDAVEGLNQGLVNANQAAAISKQWTLRELTAQNTKLGGGIGFHGWITEWENDGPRRLSWGCVVMHIYDISKLYDRIAKGTMVVIF